MKSHAALLAFRAAVAARVGPQTVYPLPLPEACAGAASFADPSDAFDYARELQGADGKRSAVAACPASRFMAIACPPPARVWVDEASRI